MIALALFYRDLRFEEKKVRDGNLRMKLDISKTFDTIC